MDQALEPCGEQVITILEGGSFKRLGRRINRVDRATGKALRVLEPVFEQSEKKVMSFRTVGRNLKVLELVEERSEMLFLELDEIADQLDRVIRENDN